MGIRNRPAGTWTGLAPALLALWCAGALARAEPQEWAAARELTGEIQAPTPRLPESERQRYLVLFAQMEKQRERLEDEERKLIARLTAERADLVKHSQASAGYEEKRAAWRSRLAQHNGQCDRSFRDPAAVARCDESGGRLAAEQRALDAEEAALAQAAAGLSARQAESASRAKQLEKDYAAWTEAIEPKLAAPLRLALAAKASRLQLTVKSFIKALDLSSMSAESRPRAERIFARATNVNFSENPASPAPGAGDFRLWSQVTVFATCKGDTLASWKVSNLAHRGGKELGLFQAETSVMAPLKIVPAGQGKSGAKSLGVSYAIQGRPNDAVLGSFQAVKPRTCHTIWHRVHATVTCRAGAAGIQTQLEGSRFPSHRVWIEGKETVSRDQGPFSALWDCDPSSPELVR